MFRKNHIPNEGILTNGMNIFLKEVSDHGNIRTLHYKQVKALNSFSLETQSMVSISTMSIFKAWFYCIMCFIANEETPLQHIVQGTM